MNLPTFRYHPDPVATGSFEKDTIVCACCGQEREYAYAGPIFSDEELDGELCPWCIADGTAHKKLRAEFVDANDLAGLDESRREEVVFRTPGFMAWQQPRWLTCCNDAALFLGRAGVEELQSKWPDAIPSIKADSALEDDDWEEYFAILDTDTSPTAYVFQCSHCGTLLGYSDSD